MSDTKHLHDAGTATGLAHDAARTFLLAQAGWLAHGLASGDDPEVVGMILGLHDATHPSWCALIADVDAMDHDAAALLMALYGFHGRIVGSLERGEDPRLEKSVAVQVRLLLARRLEELTRQAVRALEALS